MTLLVLMYIFDISNKELNKYFLLTSIITEINRKNINI